MTESSDREYLVWGDERVKNFDLRNEAWEDLDEDVAGAQQALQTNKVSDWMMHIVYYCDEDECNMLTLENFK